MSVLSAFPGRLISLAPGITEIIFKLDCGYELVGVTKFCDYPEHAKSIEKVGGFIDLNIEAIVSLKPDIIFHYPEHYQKIKILKRKAKLVSVDHRDLKDLYNSIKKISTILNRKNKGQSIVNEIKSRLKEISLKTEGKKKKVLIVAGRDPFQLRNITIVGKSDFLNEILQYSGGKNCYNGDLYYPTISIESIISLNPEVIIEFSFFFKKSDPEEIIRQWYGYDQIKAVSNRKIFVVKDQFWLRPGPRVIKIAEKLFEILNSKNVSVSVDN